MPYHSETKKIPYSAEQMFNLVGDIGSYDQFLPWCSAARIKSTQNIGDETVIEADLVISFKVFREKFGSRVTLNHATKSIQTEYLDGPFKYMNSDWGFTDVEGGCEVKFMVDFEFKNAILQGLIGIMFNEAMQRIVRAFERRAAELYAS